MVAKVAVRPDIGLNGLPKGAGADPLTATSDLIKGV